MGARILPRSDDAEPEDDEDGGSDFRLVTEDPA
jgi:hypothetical protein